METRKSLIGEIAAKVCWLPDMAGGFRVPGELRLDDLPVSCRRDEALAKALGMVQPVIEEASRQLGISADLLRALQDNPDLLEKLEKDVQALRFVPKSDPSVDPAHDDNSGDPRREPV
ncbi:hypothetical protein [Actinomadura coerulea]|uniref:hypothetical protein n=1 Tax=Actinomadura coerulea TaxID=46159 RepID=UPI0034357697